jgi:hypothetical protein
MTFEYMPVFQYINKLAQLWIGLRYDQYFTPHPPNGGLIKLLIEIKMIEGDISKNRK